MLFKFKLTDDLKEVKNIDYLALTEIVLMHYFFSVIFFIQLFSPTPLFCFVIFFYLNKQLSECYINDNNSRCRLRQGVIVGWLCVRLFLLFCLYLYSERQAER